jgi:hypothetical protein
MAFTEYKDRERVKAAAHNVAMVGAEDILLTFDFPKEWEVEFKSKYYRSGDKAYVDMTIEDAISFGLRVLEVALDAKRIWNEYDAYIKEEMRDDTQ